MANIIRRADPPNFACTVSSQAARMAAVENRKEPRCVRQVGVQIIKIIVCNCRSLGPRKVIRHETLVDVIYFTDHIVDRELGPVSAVEQNPLHPIFCSLQQPVQAIANRISGCPIVENNSNIFRIKPPFLKKRTH